MNYTSLGRTGLKVSRICLGTGAFGSGKPGRGEFGGVLEDEAFEIMDAALDAGINFFDTANVYGGIGHRGMCEEIIGRWFAQGGKRRERVVLGTKVGRVLEEDDTDGPNKPQGLSLYKIRRHFEGSLRRLQTDHIELYQMHHVDRSAPWEELWEGFEGLVKSGKLDYVGSCNFDGWDIMKAQMYARERHFMGLVNEQHVYNLFNRTAEREVFACTMDQGLGVTIYSPLARGALGINALQDINRPISWQAREALEKHHGKLVAYSQLCRELGQSEATVAIAWILENPAVTSVIIGPSSVAEMNEVLGAVDLKLDADVKQRLDEIFVARDA